MLSNFTKKYILRRARKEKIIIPQNYREILENYCQIVTGYGYKLEFRKGRGLRYNRLGANAGWHKDCAIVATPEWAYQLVTNPEADLPFRITLGHELTHKERNLIGFRLCTSKFYAWINEIHADYGASQKMFSGSRKALLDSICFKNNDTRKYGGCNKDTSSHPSWTKRKYYVENFDFDANLIQQIAKDVNYKNSKGIERACSYFQPIELK